MGEWGISITLISITSNSFTYTSVPIISISFTPTPFFLGGAPPVKFLGANVALPLRRDFF